MTLEKLLDSPAPDFSLSDQDGKTFTLSKMVGTKNIVLYFYPKDDTPGCTKEACSFRDSFEDFLGADALVVGVSSDDKNSHQNFASKYKLPYPLLSDIDGEVRKAYRVPKTLGLIPGRVTFVIDKKGVIRHLFSSQFNAQKHIKEALESLKNLK